MSKIKDIEISDFRIYEGLQRFSFESPLGLSNLMVIYAPNGFGKTSFFDAIEWCYSSKIRRFENEYLHDEIDRREYSDGDKILLTNRKSYRSGKKGTVTIRTTDEKSITRTAKIRKITNSDFKHDYRPGSDFRSELDERTLSNLIRTNILTQDQIDAFLRYTRPEEKFMALKEFWPEGEAATDILKKLSSFESMTYRELEEVKSNAEELKKNIDLILFSPENMSAVNAAIEAIGRDSLSGFNVEPLSGTIDDEIYKAVLDVTEGSIKRTSVLQEVAEGRLARLIQLELDFTSYILAVDSSAKLHEDLVKLTQVAKLYIDRRATGQSLVSCEQLVFDHSELLKKFTRLLEISGRFSSLIETIAIQQNLIGGLYEINNSLLTHIETFNQTLERLQVKEAEIQKDVKELRKTIFEWDKNFLSYQFWKDEQVKQGEKLKQLQEQIDIYDTSINNHTLRKQSLLRISESLQFEGLEDADKSALSDQLLEYSLVLIETNEVIVSIQSLNTEIDRSTALDEALSRLLTWGEDYVKSLNAEHCPLCATKFADTASLINAILSQKESKGLTSTLKDDLSRLRSREVGLIQQKEIIIGKIRQYIVSQVTTCDKQIEATQINRLNFSNEAIITRGTLEQAGSSLQNFTKLLLSDDRLANEPINVRELKNKLTQEVTAKEEKLKRQRALIVMKSDMIAQKRQSINLNEIKVNAAENTIALSKADMMFIEGEILSRELKLERSDVNNKQLQIRILAIEEELAGLNKQVEELKNKLEDINRSSIKGTSTISEEELPGLQSVKQGEKSDYDKTITKYLENLNSLLPLAKAELATIQGAIASQDTVLARLETEKRALDELKIRLALIEQDATKARLEKELIKQREKLGPLEFAVAQLVSAKETAKKYINREINSFFNQDVINQIYSRIEPHPNLNEIDFNPQLSDRGLILNVQALSKDERLNPVLYLSAGQLNVLSLSIFLAKAFEFGNDLISTIFMDDPIQNLSDINVLSFIDLIRTMITSYDRQIVMSTHDENFYRLMKHKMPSDAFNVVYYEMSNFGSAHLAS